MIVVEAADANQLYSRTAHDLLAEGLSVSPRGMATTETLGAMLRLTNPRARLLELAPHRTLNPAFAIAEALWIISGSDASWIFEYNANLKNYTDDGVLRGAYGPRIRSWGGRTDQVDQVLSVLRRDPDSRQAVLQIYSPEVDQLGFRDVPCTLNYRFFVRQERLHMHTTMRSNDFWLGLPYDIFNATLLQELVAGWLGLELGTYTHCVDSLHIYAEHIDLARRIPVEVPASQPMAPRSIELADLDALVEALIGPDGGSIDTPPGWADAARVLETYRVWKSGELKTARATANANRVHSVLDRSLAVWLDKLILDRGSRAKTGAPRL